MKRTRGTRARALGISCPFDISGLSNLNMQDQSTATWQRKKCVLKVLTQGKETIKYLDMRICGFNIFETPPREGAQIFVLIQSDKQLATVSIRECSNRFRHLAWSDLDSLSVKKMSFTFGEYAQPLLLRYFSDVDSHFSMFSCQVTWQRVSD